MSSSLLGNRFPTSKRFWQGGLVIIAVVGLSIGGIVPVLASSATTTSSTYEVRIVTTNSPVIVGETLDVFATVQNTGDEAGTQTVTLAINGVVRDQQEVALSPGEDTSIKFSWQPAEGDAGTYAARVASENDADMTNVTIRPAGLVRLNSCRIIAESGEYILGQSLANADIDPCIRIRASNVTLNGAGYTIDGVDRDVDSVGLAVDTRASRANVAVRNLTLTGWGTGLQVGTTHTTDIRESVIENVTATGNRQTGIAVRRGHAIRFRNTKLLNNTNGITLESSSGNVLQNTTTRNNSNTIVFKRASANRLQNTRIRNTGARNRNQTNAIVLTASANNVLRNTIVRNHTSAIVLNGSANNTFQTTTIGYTDNWAVVASPSEATGSSANNTFDTVDLGLANATVSFRLRDAAVKAVKPAAAPAPPANMTVVGGYLKTTTNDQNGYLTLTVAYRDNAVAGIAESSLRLWRHSSNWSVIGGTVNKEANTVTGRLRFVNSMVAPLAATAIETKNEPPQATFDYSPQSPSVGERVRIYVTTAADADGRIESYEWQIDGAIVSTTESVEYTFESGGTHEVTLTVTDDDGASTTSSVRVTVSTPTPTPTPTQTPTPSPGQGVPGFGVAVAAMALLATGLLASRLD